MESGRVVPWGSLILFVLDSLINAIHLHHFLQTPGAIHASNRLLIPLLWSRWRWLLIAPGSSLPLFPDEFLLSLLQSKFEPPDRGIHALHWPIVRRHRVLLEAPMPIHLLCILVRGTITHAITPCWILRASSMNGAIIDWIFLKSIEISLRRALAVARYWILPVYSCHSLLAPVKAVFDTVSRGPRGLAVTFTRFLCFRRLPRVIGLFGWFFGSRFSIRSFYLPHALNRPNHFLAVYQTVIHASLIAWDYPSVFLFNWISHLPLLLLMFVSIVKLLKPVNLGLKVFLLHGQWELL